MKKLVAICLAVVFTLNFVGCHSSEKSQSANSGAVSDALDLSGCENAEDYINVAGECIENNDIYLANEVIKAGYRATQDSKLKMVVLSGAPTIESIVLEYELKYRNPLLFGDWLGNTVQYVLGKDSVISVPNGYNFFVENPWIYHFDENNKHIRSISIGSPFTYDELDNELLSFALSQTNRLMFNPAHIFQMDTFSDSLINAVSAKDQREKNYLNCSYTLKYDGEDNLTSISYGGYQVSLTKTETGYQVITPNDSYKVEMTNNRISKMMMDADGTPYAYAFEYKDDGSYLLKWYRGNSESSAYENDDTKYEKLFNSDDYYVRSYNSNCLLGSISEVIDGEITERTVNTMAYNKNGLLTRVHHGSDYLSENIEYKDDWLMTSYLGLIFFQYDSENRVISCDIHENLQSDETTVGSNYTYNENGKISYYSFGYAEYPHTYSFKYDDNKRLVSFKLDGYDEEIKLTRNENGDISGIEPITDSALVSHITSMKDEKKAIS